MAVTVQMIKELRDRTGVGMNKCKEALVEANGDMQQAIENLRKAGMASAVKKGGRETKEGMIITAESGNVLAMVEVNAETDFVVKNETFQAFAQTIAQEAATKKLDSVEKLMETRFSGDESLTLDEYRASIVQKIGENIQVKRIQLIEKAGDMSLGVYSHMGGKIVAIAELAGSSDQNQAAYQVAMHIAACRPDYLDPDHVPDITIEKEREIARAQIEGKPENIIEKILDGKLKAFYKQACLSDQPFIQDEDLTVSEFVKKAGNDLKVQRFFCWEVGVSA